MAWRARSRRGRRAGHVHGGPPGTWEAPPSSRRVPAGAPGDQLRAPAGAPDSRGSKPRVRAGYRRAKATKRDGTGGGESEHLILPATRGNRPEGPRRGKGVPGHETVGGKDAGDTEP